jgi:beta-barrel assembly-enhancing protease
MRFSEDQSKQTGPQVAPPPAPPPAMAASMTTVNAQGGFDPKGGRLMLEILFGLGVIVGLGVLVIFAGGLIASWLAPAIPLSVDQTIGAAAQREMSLTQKECSNPAVKKYVEDLAQPMIDAAGKVPFTFSFRVVDTPEVNAFALPGGFVTVNRGLLEAAESGEEVAGVIGHEIQHAILRHGTKRILRQLGGTVLMNLLFGGGDLAAVSHAAGQMTGLSYDRAQELEADKEGVALMVAAGMDPRGLARFFERLSEGALHPPEILSTHPDPGARADLVSRAAEGTKFRALPLPSSAPCHVP